MDLALSLSRSCQLERIMLGRLCERLHPSLLKIICTWEIVGGTSLHHCRETEQRQSSRIYAFHLDVLHCIHNQTVSTIYKQIYYCMCDREWLECLIRICLCARVHQIFDAMHVPWFNMHMQENRNAYHMKLYRQTKNSHQKMRMTVCGGEVTDEEMKRKYLPFPDWCGVAAAVSEYLHIV